jgi:hypothetical protein
MSGNSSATTDRVTPSPSDSLLSEVGFGKGGRAPVGAEGGVGEEGNAGD